MIIKFSIDKIEYPRWKEFGFHNNYTDKYEIKLFHIDEDFLKLLGGYVWHIDFKDKKIFMRHSSTPCRVNKDRFSILIDTTHTHITKFTDVETLFYLNRKCNTSVFETDIKNFKELFIKAMYVLVENYKKVKNVN